MLLRLGKDYNQLDGRILELLPLEPMQIIPASSVLHASFTGHDNLQTFNRGCMS